MDIILVVALTFGLCFGIDKLFTNTFRSKPQHKSGRAVRLSSRYALVGLVLIVVGVAALVSGSMDTWALTAGGVVVVILGIGLIVYHMTFGIFYDDDSFIVTTFGKKSVTYSYADIRCQQLYVVQGGNIVVELHMTDGRAVQLQAGMDGMYPFLDHAYSAWLRQTGRNPEECTFHDPSNSCWFPSVDAEV